MSKYKFLLFLVLLLFSFTINVNATISNYSSSVKYSNDAIDIINNNQDKIQLINQYFRNNGVRGFTFDFSTGDILIIYDINSLNTNSIKAYICNVTQFSYLQNYYGGNYNMYKKLYISLSSWGYNFTYDNGTISKSGSEIYFGGFDVYYSGVGNPTIEDVVLEISDYYFDTSFISDTSIFSFSLNGAGVQTDIPYNLNGTIYTPPTSLPTKLFFDSFLFSSSYNLETDNFILSNNFTTLRIDDIVNNGSGSLKLRYTFNVDSDINSIDPNFKFYQYGGLYDTTISDVSCGSQYSYNLNDYNYIAIDCDFTINYDYSSGQIFDIEDKIFFDIIPNLNYDYLVSSSNTNISLAFNDTDRNNLYSYRDLFISDMNLNDMGMFYFRNYNMLNYRDDLKSINFNFNWNTYNSIVLPRDLLGHSQYWFNIVPSYFSINNGNISTPSLTFLPFGSENTINLYKYFYNSVNYGSNYPCLYIMRVDDYSGNKSYIRFNNTLLSFRSALYSIDSNDIVNYEFVNSIPYIDYSNDNNNQNNNSVSYADFDSDYTFENSPMGGVDISAFINYGFGYWRDKIVEMFKYVSNFFEMQPLKYQNAMIFVFMLLIGILLFRLLL